MDAVEWREGEKEEAEEREEAIGEGCREEEEEEEEGEKETRPGGLAGDAPIAGALIPGATGRPAVRSVLPPPIGVERRENEWTTSLSSLKLNF